MRKYNWKVVGKVINLLNYYAEVHKIAFASSG